MGWIRVWSDPAWRRTFGYYALFICLGSGMGVGGPTLPDLARQTGSALGSMGLLFLCGSVGYALGTFLGGRLYDRVRGHPLLGSAQTAAAVCIALIPLVPWLWLLLAIAVIRGIAEGLVNTGANTLLLWTHGEKASPFMNGLHFFFGFGAFVAPLIVGRLTGIPGGYRWAYWAVAAFAALAGLRVATMQGSPRPAARREESVQGRGGAAARSIYGPIAVAAVYLFLYVGAEISFGTWVYSYAVMLGLASAAGAAYLTSAFWLSFTAGRLVSIPVAMRLTPRQVIPLGIAGCLALSGLMMVLPQSGALLWGAAIGLGFCMAPLWPTGFTLAGQVIPLTAFASALVLLGDSFGGMVLPSLTGKLFEAAGPQRMALSLPLLVFLSLLGCLAAFLSLLVLARRRTQATATEAGVAGEA